MQETWLAKVNALISAVPLDHAEKGDPEYEVRQRRLNDLRLCIAARWKQVFELQKQIPLKDWDRVQQELSSCISGLIDIHGEEIPFAPDMSAIVSIGSSENVPLANAESSPSIKTSTSSSLSSLRQCLEHEFRWVEMNEGVWTVMIVL